MKKALLRLRRLRRPRAAPRAPTSLSTAWDSGPGSVLVDMHTIGSSHAIVPMAPPEHRADEDSVARLAET